MEINLYWKEKCNHCNGDGKCSYYDDSDDEDDACFYGCIKSYRYYSRSRKLKKPQLDRDNIICACCGGKGYVLSELGKQFEEFVNEWYWPKIENELQNIRDEITHEYDKQCD